MTEEQIKAVARDYAGKILETDIYLKYSHEKDRIKKHPDLYRQVNEFRESSFELQNETDQDQLFDRMDAFEREYEKFRENPIVEGFLRAELNFCRMMQSLNELIMDHIDFE